MNRYRILHPVTDAIYYCFDCERGEIDSATKLHLASLDKSV